MKKLIISLIICAGVLVGCGEESHLWPGGRIPFVPIGLSAEELDIVTSAMMEWEIASGGAVHFTLTDQVGDGVLHVVSGPRSDMVGGSATIGYDKHYPSYCKIGNDEYKILLQTARHELGHVVGLDDDYIEKTSIMYFKWDWKTHDINIIDALKVRDMYDTKL